MFLTSYIFLIAIKSKRFNNANEKMEMEKSSNIMESRRRK